LISRISYEKEALKRSNADFPVCEKHNPIILESAKRTKDDKFCRSYRTRLFFNKKITNVSFAIVSLFDKLLYLIKKEDERI